MKKELFEKLVKDQPLTAHEAHELDQILDAQEKLGVSHLVRRVSADEPSLAWRSSLNQALSAQAPVKPKKSPWLVFGTVLAPAAAAVALAVFVFNPGFNRPAADRPSVQMASSGGDLESALLLVHQSEEASTVAASSPPSSDGRFFEWSDLGPY